MGVVCGKGWYEPGDKYVCSVNKQTTKEYQTWRNMLSRCYKDGGNGTHPAYQDCTVDERFLDFQQFCLWLEPQQGFYKGFQLDKDLLIKGNKVYSPDSCTFIPKEINLALTKRESKRSNLPIGVHAYRKRFIAAMNGKPHQIHIGVFDTPQEAFLAYKVVKEITLKVLAEKYQQDIDERAYLALDNYNVEIGD